MNKEFEKLNTQATDLLNGSQKIADITETILDALTYCDDNVKSCYHVISVVELLKTQINKFLEDADTHEQDTLRISLKNK